MTARANPSLKGDGKARAVLIYVDGSSTSGGGAGGWAFTAEYGPYKATRCGWGEEETNNTCELKAIIHALWFVRPEEGRAVEIHSDSKYAIGALLRGPQWQADGWINSAGKTPANLDLVQRGMALIQAHKAAGTIINLQHVRGHRGIPGNERADALAGEARLNRLQTWNETADAKFAFYKTTIMGSSNVPSYHATPLCSPVLHS